jgi:Ca2+-binding EF-hand superfamily protein
VAGWRVHTTGGGGPSASSAEAGQAAALPLRPPPPPVGRVVEDVMSELDSLVADPKRRPVTPGSLPPLQDAPLPGSAPYAMPGSTFEVEGKADDGDDGASDSGGSDDSGPPSTDLTDEQIADFIEKYPWMSDESVRKLIELFKSWDEDGSGEISCEEMGEMLRKVVRDLFDKMDSDNSGSINVKELADLTSQMGVSMSKNELEDEVRAMKGGQGKLSDGVSFDEFDRWWNGEYENGEVSSEELMDLFMEVDEDGSGEVDIMEFLDMIALKMEGKDLDERSAFQMVRAALESVRDDVRAIYGSSAKPKGALERMRELEAEGGERCCFFRPDGNTPADKLRKLWDVAQVVLLTYVALAVPYRMGFQKDVPFNTSWFWVEVVVDVYFMLDILINFRTAYRTEEGELVTSPKKISRNYLKGWFAIDICACFPVTYIGLIISGTDSDQQGAQKVKALKIIRLLRLAKMLRLARLKRLIKRIDEEFPGLWTVSQLFSLVVIIMYVSHLFACGWYMVGLDKQTLPDQQELLGWVHRAPNGADEPWGPEVEWTTRYIDAYYYAITTLTTVGYGDKLPVTDSEKMYSIATELAGGMIFGILAGTLSAMLTEAGAAAAEVENELDMIKGFMLSKSVGKETRRTIMSKMETFYKGKGLYDESEILDKLPPKFKKRLLVEMYKPQLTS